MSSITLVGCGFLGSHLTDHLCKLLYSQDLGNRYDLRLIDFDKWDLRNPANQFVTIIDAQANNYKVQTLAKRAQSYLLSATPIQAKLDMNNAGELLENSALVIDCVDNIPTRQLLWALGKGGLAPVIHAGISKTGQGRIDWSSSTFDSFPYTPDAIAGRQLKDDDAVKEPPCEMFKYMYSGLRTVEATTKAISLFLGCDPWRSAAYLTRAMVENVSNNTSIIDQFVTKTIEQDGHEFTIPGTMTCWVTGKNSINIRADETTLNDGFYPIHPNNKELV